MKGKNETGVARKKIIFDLFFQLIFFFCLLPQVFKHSMSWPESFLTHFTKKNCKV